MTKLEIGNLNNALCCFYNKALELLLIFASYELYYNVSMRETREDEDAYGVLFIFFREERVASFVGRVVQAVLGLSPGFC